MTASKYSGTAFKIIGWFIAAMTVMGFAFVAAPHAYAATLNDDGNAVVESGDNLTKIARELLGDASRWREIAELNNIQNPNLITPGQELTLPESDDDDEDDNDNGDGGGTGGVIVDDNDDDGGTTVIIDDGNETEDIDEDDFDLFSLLLLGGLFDDGGTCVPSEDNEDDHWNLFDLFILSELF